MCEYLNHAKYKTNWIKVRIVFIGENLTVLKLVASGSEFSERMADVSFRPLRTPEVIAAEEERLEAIGEMISYVGHYNIVRDAVAALYDAGYRKTDAENALANLVEALEQGFPLLSDEGLDEVEHHCEWVIQRERERVHHILAAHRKGGDYGGV